MDSGFGRYLIRNFYLEVLWKAAEPNLKANSLKSISKIYTF